VQIKAGAIGANQGQARQKVIVTSPASGLSLQPPKRQVCGWAMWQLCVHELFQ